MRKLNLTNIVVYTKSIVLCLFSLAFSKDIHAQVNVNASAGTATGSYATINAAFAAINAGTHQGAITLTITSDINNEPFFPTSLNASVGTTSYTSITIVPSGNRIVTNTMTGLNNNRGMLELFGASNVTIDGDDPSTAGSKNLTFEVTTAAPNFTVAIRIGSVSATVAPSNITIKNCIIRGGRGSNNSATPNYCVAISSNSPVSITNPGTSISNITIDSCSLERALTGIFINGPSVAAGAYSNMRIINNSIGVTTNPTNYIGGTGISVLGVGGGVASLIENNKISVGLPGAAGFASANAIGIDLFSNCLGMFIRNNELNDIINVNAGASQIAGIRITGALNTGIFIFNNIIKDVVGPRRNPALGGFANYGLFLGAGVTGVNFFHNTIAMNSPNTLGAVPYLCAGVFAANTASFNDFRNNIIVNKNFSLNSYLIGLGGTAASTFNATQTDRNCFFVGNSTSPFSNISATLSGYQISTNLERTSFLENVAFVSGANARVTTGSVTRLESNSLNSNLLNDIDYQVRPGPAGSVNGGATSPDIGADEVDAIKYAPSVINSVTAASVASSCNATARTINANVTLGNAFDTVKISYRFGVGAWTTQAMGQVSTNNFSFSIPAPTPAGATVSYQVFTNNVIADTTYYAIQYYNFRTADSAFIPSITADPPAVCANTPITLTYTYPQDPTGVNVPPTVISPLNLSDISSFNFLTINNSTPINSLVGTIGTATTGAAGAYSSFRGITTPAVALGGIYPFSISSLSNNGTGRDFFAIYIDFNGDGDFNDAGENIFNTPQVRDLGPRTQIGEIYIRASARPGITTMRCIVSNSAITSPLPDINTGEVEDYTIQIKPNVLEWFVGASSAGTANPTTTTITTVPASIALLVTDSTICTTPLNAAPLNIVAPPATMAVTITASPSFCYATPYQLTANVTGGCPPYTYSWTGTASGSTKTIPFTTYGPNGSTSNFQITVTDRNGLAAFANTANIPTINPALTLPDTTIICNRGTTIITATKAVTDSALWYNDPSSPRLSFIHIGNSFTTPTLNSTTSYYAAAFRSSSALIGRANPTLSAVTSLVQNHAGLTFSTSEPIIIQRCSLYIAGAGGSTIRIGVLDKFGTIIAQTPILTPTLAANATLPTVINLNLSVPNPDAGYRLAVLSSTGITTFNRNANVFFPISVGQAMVITGGYNVLLPGVNDYNYFYNIAIQRNMCVGQLDTAVAHVRAPRVPKITQDIRPTKICKKDSLFLDLISDSVATDFVWYKDGNAINVLSSYRYFSPSRDSSYTRLAIPGDINNTRGNYSVSIISTKFCSRDTISLEVRPTYHAEPEFTKLLQDSGMCVRRDHLLSAAATNARIYYWYKNGVPILNDSVTPISKKTDYLIKNAAIGSDIYTVIAEDSNKCALVGNTASIVVLDTPSITVQPLDTVICSGDKYIVTANVQNTRFMQWYKDNGILPFYNQNSITLWSAQIGDSGLYRLKASSYPGCPDADSRSAKIVVNPSPIVNGHYNDIKICQGTKLSLISNASQYQDIKWYKDNIFIGITGDSLIKHISVLSDSGIYQFEATPFNKCQSKFSNKFKVNVFKESTIPALSLTNKLICEGTNFNQAIPTTNGYIYQWYKNRVTIQDQRDSILKLEYVSFKDTGVYRLSVTSDEACPPAFSNSFRIDVQKAPKIVLQPVGGTFCIGSNIVLRSSATDATSYTWKKDGIILGNGSTPNFTVNKMSIANAGKYTVEISGTAPCTNIVSDTAILVVKSGNTNAHLASASVYDAIEQCTDDDDWTYYSSENEPDKYIFAIRKKLNNIIGKVDVVLRPSVLKEIANNRNEYSGTLMLPRFWNFKVEAGNLEEAYDVKFYYDLNEVQDLDKTKVSISDLLPTAKFEPSTMTWYKTDTNAMTSALISKIKGNVLGFKHSALKNSDLGVENNVNYIVFYDVEGEGGGSAFYSFSDNGKIYTRILDLNTDISSAIYPNPNNGEFDIEVSSKLQGKITLAVTNSLGQTVYKENLVMKKAQDKFHLNIPNLSNGIYQVQISKDDHKVILKMQVFK